MATISLRTKYLNLVRKIFPTGKAWERIFDADSTLSKLSDAYADELSKIHDRANTLIREVDPRSTSELLTDWERLLGLPDQCDTTEGQTIQERRTRILQVLTTRGGQNEAFYKELASNFGFSVDVISAEDQPPFVAGSKAGDRLTNGNWRYAFVIKAPAEFLIRFRAGQGAAGDPLIKVGNDTLQCLMEKYKPAHTIVLFSFGDGEF